MYIYRWSKNKYTHVYLNSRYKNWIKYLNKMNCNMMVSIFHHIRAMGFSMLRIKVFLKEVHSSCQVPLWCCVCIINSYSTLLNWTIVRLLILFILFSMFFVLIHDYTLWFTGSPYCNFSYYNYISIWPYYIVIHLNAKCEYLLARSW